MEDCNKNIPFPQANDFDKVIRILNVDKADKLSDKNYMSMQLDMITDRQVQYYLSACAYLGLINANKEFTSVACELRNRNMAEQTVELARLIVADKVFGTAYFTQKMYSIKLSTEDIVEIMKENDVFFESDAMYIRRAQTVSSWIAWIQREFDKT